MISLPTKTLTKKILGNIFQKKAMHQPCYDHYYKRYAS